MARMLNTSLIGQNSRFIESGQERRDQAHPAKAVPRIPSRELKKQEEFCSPRPLLPSSNWNEKVRL